MKQSIDALVEGGQASGGPPLGPALGPMGINVSKVIDAINEKTKAFKGMKVPVKVVVDTVTKDFEISVGTPPTSALIKQELGLEKGSAEAKGNIVGDLTLENVVKIARMKKEGMLASDIKGAVKEVIGTCASMGISVGGRDPREIQKEIAEGAHEGLFKE